jgi:hypothetical protein
MAASPTAYLFYGVILDAPAMADLEDDDAYVAMEEALAEHGVNILHFGETPAVHLALSLARSIVMASSGEAAVVRSLDVGSDWDARLSRACEIIELPAQKPAWYVTSRVSW